MVAGPKGLAYVVVYPDGTTAPGWGQDSFMDKYYKNTFSERRARAIFERDTPMALVMRSTTAICIDIDGKNGGFDSAAGLILPPTLAETSKSGNGYHLFYEVPDTWDTKLGFAKFGDRIGFLPGVDIRGTGCVYHHPQQQWNTRGIVPLPEHVEDRLKLRSSALETSIAQINMVRASDDPVEILMMQENVKSRLTLPIPAGKRNNTLFAIGAEMQQAGILGWEQQVLDRAIEVGLDQAEAEKLVRNVERYGSK